MQTRPFATFPSKHVTIVPLVLCDGYLLLPGRDYCLAESVPSSRADASPRPANVYRTTRAQPWYSAYHFAKSTGAARAA